MNKLYLGIDPGAHGYLAAIDCKGNVIWTEPMPMIGKELDAARLWQLLGGEADTIGFVVLEEQQAYPKDSSRSSFRIGYGYGAIVLALHAAGLRFETMKPAKWKKAMGIRVPNGTSKKIRKKRGKELALTAAKRLFPGQNFVPDGKRVDSHDMAEALLLAEVGRRTVG